MIADEMSQDFVKYTDTISTKELLRLFETDYPVGAWFTEAELQKFSPARNAGSLGARLLIKRRICGEVKCAGLGKEIEILNDTYGKPVVMLGEKAREALEKAGYRQVMCSISHSRNYIAGMTVFCK